LLPVSTVSSLYSSLPLSPSFFFFNDTPTTEIYTLSLHDALPISDSFSVPGVIPIDTKTRTWVPLAPPRSGTPRSGLTGRKFSFRSEEHTSELQSLTNLVCRLLLEKKKTKTEAHHRRRYTVS